MAEEMASGSKFQRQRPSERRRKKGNSEVRGEEKSRETEKAQAGPPILRAFKGGGLGGVPGKDMKRIFISSPGVPFQGHGLH